MCYFGQIPSKHFRANLRNGAFKDKPSADIECQTHNLLRFGIVSLILTELHLSRRVKGMKLHHLLRALHQKKGTNQEPNFGHEKIGNEYYQGHTSSVKWLARSFVPIKIYDGPGGSGSIVSLD